MNKETMEERTELDKKLFDFKESIYVEEGVNVVRIEDIEIFKAFINQELQSQRTKDREEVLEKMNKIEEKEPINTENVHYQSFVLGYQRALSDLKTILKE